MSTSEDEDELTRLRRQLGRQIDSLDGRLTQLRADAYFVAVGNALGTALVVLTATTWLVEGGDLWRTAWSMGESVGLFGTVELVTVLVLAAGTLAASTVLGGSRLVHLLMAAVAVLAEAFAMVVAATGGGYIVTAPGLWLTALVALATAMMHLNRSTR